MKKKTRSNVAAMIKKSAEKMTEFNCGVASGWGLHQPKEPKTKR